MTKFNSNRRNVLKRSFLSAGGTLLLASSLRPVAAFAEGIKDPVDPADDVEYQVPKGFKKGAQIDARYQISYRRSVPAACRVMAAHFDAISQRDYSALANTLHFPFAIVERIDVLEIKSPDELTNEKAPPSLNFSPNGQMQTNHFSRMEPGDYDMLISLEVINFDPVHVNMAMTFDRYNRHGFRTIRCEGVYCVTNNDGKWAIQLMSTIWTPDELIGRVYQDAVQAAIRLRENHTMSYIDDTDIIDRPRPNRGPRAMITGGGIGALFESQQGGDPLAQFKIRGVKSRLGVSDRKLPNAMEIDPANRGRPEKGEHIPKWKPILDEYSKQGNADYYESIAAPATRIIHQTGDKVHRYSGAARYTVDGAEVSISMEVAVIVMGSGADWTEVAGFRYVTVHDRNNDDRT